MAKRNDFVRLHIQALAPEERAPHIPEDTRAVPLEMWVKGYLLADAEMGQVATVRTCTGREVSGKLVEVNPGYTHSFGQTIPELLAIGESVREILFGGEQK